MKRWLVVGAVVAVVLVSRPVASQKLVLPQDPVATFSYLTEELHRRGLLYLHVAEPIAGPSAVSSRSRITPILRHLFDGAVIVNGGYDRASGDAAVAAGDADLVAYGVPFLANPDLPERFRRDAELNQPDTTTFYMGEETGYIDYPTLESAQAVPV